jgi:hypothetical protein
VPVAPAPGLALQFAPAPPWWFELGLLAPALSTLHDDTGSAMVDQEVVALKLAASTPLATWAQGFVALGGGAYRLGVSGTGTPPYSGHRDHVLSATGLLSVGSRIRLHSAWSLQLDATAILTTPRAEVLFADRVRARSGLPLFAAGVSAWLDL